MDKKEQYKIAREYAPEIYFDKREPFLPIKVGYTITDKVITSPSFQRKLEPPERGVVIEYAIYWDWDITHHYDLEHLWVFVDKEGMVEAFEGSAHGLCLRLWPDPPSLEEFIYALYNKKKLDRGKQPLSGTDRRKGKNIWVLTAYSQPGKHGFAPDPGWFSKHREFIIKECTLRAGKDGLHQGFPGKKITVNEARNRLVKKYLQDRAFVPSFEFEQRFSLAGEQLLVPWEQLKSFIPSRIENWMRVLQEAESSDNTEEENTGNIEGDKRG